MSRDAGDAEIAVMTFADVVGTYDTVDEAVSAIIEDVLAYPELYQGDEEGDFAYPGGPPHKKFRSRLRLVVVVGGERVW